MTQLNILLLSDYAEPPSQAHETDACFDIYVDLSFGITVPYKTRYNYENKGLESLLYTEGDSPENWSIELPPFSSTLVTTGWACGIPAGYRLDINSRSGLSTKHRINLSNSVGVIDSGYLDQVYIPLQNNSAKPYKISHEDRVAQMHLEKVVPTDLEVVFSVDALSDVEDRFGGFGSSGR